MDSVSATLNYVAPDSQQNRLYVGPTGHMTTTRYAPREVPITDGRPFRDDFSLDGSGFTLLDHRSAVTDFGDAAQLDGIYAREACDLVQRATGADHVGVIGWVLRRSGPDRGDAQPPAPDVHVDIHPGRADARFQAASDRPYRRAVMSSLWRAFSPPPQDEPLAVLDYRSVADDEGTPNLLLFVDELPDPDHVPGIADPDSEPAGTVFTHRPGHRWWYFPDLRVDEAILLKLHDTDHSVAWRVPHTSFRDPTVPGEGHHRASVEFRTIAYFY